MKIRRPAPERDRQGHGVQLRRLENLLDLLEQLLRSREVPPTGI
jgi:hypothetical protein